MVRFVRARLSYANVVATLALFVAFGGSAAAAVIVSSNDQIAPNTVYGANVPAGKNDNIVAGSVATSDLGPSAVTNNKLAAAAVASDKLAGKSVIAGKLGDGAVQPTNLASGAVGTSKLADKAVTVPKLGTDVIDRIDSHTGTLSQFTGAVSVDTTTTVKSVAGMDILVHCASGGGLTSITMQRNTGTGILNVSGTASSDNTVSSTNIFGLSTFSEAGTFVNIDVIAANDSVGRFARVDVHVHREASDCPYWGTTQVAS
jgi:hypothetical protein